MGYPIQLTLMRQLAGYLSVPVFLVDPDGNLLSYNEPAEIILGRRFDETGKMSADEWSAAFTPLDDASQPIRRCSFLFGRSRIDAGYPCQRSRGVLPSSPNT